MSRFEQVAQEVAENSYLREWYDKVMSTIGDYSPAYLTEDRIIEAVANKMIARSGNGVPNDDDYIFFTKILWVILERTKGNYEFVPNAEKELLQKLHAKQVSLLIEKAKD
ncbi:hypothetical protein ACF3NQ_04835 [Alistipes dispar]|uniref:hypothetical protein n=1 Tax=Alistipes dispar TaxID=2585119 RepID=UPI003BF2C7A8